MRPLLDSLSIALYFTAVLHGAPAPVGSDALFDAIRRDDIPAATAALAAGADVNAPDATGATPLMHAVLYAQPRLVAVLLDHGAAANAANAVGASALMWAAPRTDIVRLLLGRGADVRARAANGTTALVVATRVANLESMRVLVEAGADVTSTDQRGQLLTAAYTMPRAGVRELLAARGVRLAAAGELNGGTLGRQRGDLEAVVTLLSSGVDPHQEIPLITTSMPAYFAAAREGSLEVMRALERAGVNPKVASGRGWTALMLAAGDDAPSLPVMRHLLASGADVNAADDQGRTALDWALTHGETAASDLLRQAGGRESPRAAAPSRTLSPWPVREAIARGIGRLQPAGPAFSSHTRCNSCHNQSLPSIAVHASRARGVTVDESLVGHSLDVTLQNWRGRRELALVGLTDVAGFQLNVEYGLLDLIETGVAATPVVDAMVFGLASRQHADGSWPPSNDIRPPLTVGIIASTALSLRGLSHFAPPGRRAEMAERVARAAAFIASAVPGDTQEQAYKMLGLLWAGAAPEAVQRERAALLALQRRDGGWGQLPTMTSDAYATGMALFALHGAGLAPAADAYQRGAEFLRRTQLDDGTWFVQTRAFGFQPYFETGFPHGRSQFISTAATALATAALAYTLPEPTSRRGSVGGW